MQVFWSSGVRVGALTFDPEGRPPIAFYTHRSDRRPAARLALASKALASTWKGVQGLPFGAGAVAAGMRLELLPTGYGPGGAAVLLAEDGYRILVVGPTTEALEPRPVDELVLFAPAPLDQPPTDWIARARDAAQAHEALALLPPDGAAAEAIAHALEVADIPHRRPTWLAGGQPRATVRIVAAPSAGVPLDLRPLASPVWQVEHARACRADRICVHGPGADALARKLTDAGLPARVIQAPAQLVLSGLSAHEAHDEAHDE